MASFRKVVVDEAHRVFSSIVYKDEDEEEEEEDEEDEEDDEDEASTTSNESSYLSQLRSVIRENNKTVLLSATIEHLFGS
jgi:CO dehydrogenase/acetyl-CoA synthase beta subunit